MSEKETCLQVLTALYSQMVVNEIRLFITGDIKEAAFLYESEKSVLETTCAFARQICPVV